MPKMTVAAALRRIKKIKGELSTLSQRVKKASTHVEDLPPAFPYEQSMAERDRKAAELVDLQAAVAASNATATVKLGKERMTPFRAIRRIEELKARCELVAGLELRERKVDAVRELVDIWEANHGKYVSQFVDKTYLSCLSMVEQAEELTRMRDEIEALNDALEASNHATTVEV